MRVVASLLVAVGLGVLCLGAELRVSVAVSLKEVVGGLAREFEGRREGGAEGGAEEGKVRLAFGSSGELAAQVRAGAEVDVFVSAGEKQVDDLVAAGLADAGSRRVIAGNTLVLIVPGEGGGGGGVTGFAGLADPGVTRVAVGEPKSVPAGMYADQTLTRLGLKEALKGRLVYGVNVRQVLALVERGEVSAGLVYATDAAVAGKAVRVVAVAPEGSHDAITYTAVVLKGTKERATAERFVAYLSSEAAAARFRAAGFAPAPGATTRPGSEPATRP